MTPSQHPVFCRRLASGAVYEVLGTGLETETQERLTILRPAQDARSLLVVAEATVERDFAGAETPADLVSFKSLASRFRHHRNGKDYELLGIALNEAGANVAVYRPLYRSEHAFFIRPEAMFFEVLPGTGRRFLPLS